MIADDLMLLLLDPSGRARADSTRVGLGLAGALLLDLAVRGRVDVATHATAGVKPGRLVVVDPSPTDDPLLDAALQRLADRHGRKPQDVLPRLAKGLREQVLRRLVARRQVTEVHGRVLGLFPTRSYPPTHADGTVAELVAGVREVLVQGRTATQREASVICLLQAIDRVPTVVGDVGLSKRELRRRAKEVSAGNAVGAAVRKAVEAVEAATAGAVAAVAAAGAAGSS